MVRGRRGRDRPPLYAAGSLRAALSEAARAFEAENTGLRVELEFAASGLLRERIEKGEKAHIFASADTGHPTRLADAGHVKTKVAIFARNQLCALAREGLAITSATLLDAMLDTGNRLGTSTPKADPSGDYALALRQTVRGPSAATPGLARGRPGAPPP